MMIVTDNHQRFKLTEKVNPTTGQMALYIRANQGHTDTSVKAEELMTPITDLSQTKTIWPSGKPTMLHVRVHTR
jgi:RNA:NAD 2'-phosphotransferase (TPT1/KptA family)